MIKFTKRVMLPVRFKNKPKNMTQYGNFCIAHKPTGYCISDTQSQVAFFISSSFIVCAFHILKHNILYFLYNWFYH